MLYFFTKIDAFALWTLIILVVFSVLIKNFWCRYLCPYGALLGFLSIFSPLKITRNEETCTDCEACTDACPHAIRVHTRLRVISDECTACGMCEPVAESRIETVEFYKASGLKLVERALDVVPLPPPWLT